MARTTKSPVNIGTEIRSGLIESRTVNSQCKQFVAVPLDNSGSMAKFRKEVERALQEFWDILSLPVCRDGYRCALITFNEHATLVQDFAPPGTIVAKNLPYAPSGETNISDAFKVTADAFRNVQRDPKLKYLNERVCLLITDGEHNVDNSDPDVYAQQLKDMGVTVVCVAFGDGCNEAAMKRWSSSGQHFAKVSSGAELRAYLADAGTTLMQTHLAGVDAEKAMAMVKTGKE